MSLPNKRGAVYWATLAFGGIFITTTVGGELIYCKFFKKNRDVELNEEKEEANKLRVFAGNEIDKRENDG